MSFAPIFYDRRRLSADNIEDYLKRKHNTSKGIIIHTERKELALENLLQKNFGKSNDCSLISITQCILYLLNREEYAGVIYNIAEDYAKKYLYNGESYGTIPIFIKNIYKKTLRYFGVNKKIYQKYFKGIGFVLDELIKTIDKNIPIILSINRDGRDYYNNHTVTIVGYETFNIYKDTNEVVEDILLLIHDHWSNEVSYLDLDFVSIISSIDF